MKKYPTSELVAMNWIRSLEGVPSDKVSTKLPRETDKIGNEGFVTVFTISGSMDLHLMRRDPILQVNCWARNSRNDKQDPPWRVANELAERIVNACFNPVNFQNRIDTPNGYERASVLQAYPVSEPRKMHIESGGDEARFAMYSFDLQLHWVRIPEELDN